MIAKKKYAVTLAYDVPCYATIVVEADSPESAEKIALAMEDDNSLYEITSFDPEWSLAGDTRISDVEESDDA